MRVVIQSLGFFRVNIVYLAVSLLSVLVGEVRVTMSVKLTEEILRQGAIVLVNAVVLVMDIAGIKVKVSGKIKKTIIQKVWDAIKSSNKMQMAIVAFVSAWKSANGDKRMQASAIFHLLKDMNLDILWDIVKGFIQSMSWIDWLKAITIFSAKVIASFVTDGAALLIMITLSLDSAVELLCDIAYLLELYWRSCNDDTEEQRGAKFDFRLESSFERILKDPGRVNNISLGSTTFYLEYTFG